MTAATLTLTAREFTALVDPVVPHASKDDTLGIICTVLVRSHGNVVTALATDRYQVGFKRITPEVEPEGEFAALIPTRVIARIRKDFRATRLATPTIKLTIESSTLTVEAADTLIGLAGATLRFDLPHAVGEFPKVDQILRDNLAGVGREDVKSLSVNPNYLADFRIGHGDFNQPMTVTATTGEHKPWVVRIGDDFIGLIVPTRPGYATTGQTFTSWLSLLDEPAKTKETAA